MEEFMDGSRQDNEHEGVSSLIQFGYLERTLTVRFGYFYQIRSH
jgi:hypothetical protein